MNYTFIIPHHNSPELLNRCLDSIPQRDDIQIIVVDDNSQETRKPKIDRNDVEVIYIDKVHTKGAGHARNAGLECAKGKWLLFADCDDFYYPGFIDALDKYTSSDNEIVYFSVGSVNSDTLQPANRYREFSLYIPKAIAGDKEALLQVKYIFKTPWYKMFSADYIKRYGFQFEEVPRSNDAMFTFLTSYFCKKYRIIEDKLYCVTYRDDSLSYKVKSLNELKYAYQNILKQNEFYHYIGIQNKTRSIYKSMLRGSDDPICLRRYMSNRLIFTIVRLFGHMSYFLRSLYVMIRYYGSITGNRNKYVVEIERRTNM